jgi:hypothetical protein
VLRKFALRSEHVGHAFNERKPLAFQEGIRTRLAVKLRQLRLEIERIQVRRRPCEVNVNDPLCSGGKMGARAFHGGFASGSAEQRVEGDATETGHAGLEEKAACLKFDGRASEKFRGGHGISSC